MRRLAIVLVQAGLFFGVTGACSSDEEHPPTPVRLMRNPGGSGGSDGGGSSGTGGSTSAGAAGESGDGGLGQGGVGVAGAGGAGGDQPLGGAGGVVDAGNAGAGGVVDAGGAGGVTDAGGAAGAGGAPSVQCLAAGTIDVTPASLSDWSILGENDPTLILCRGSTYTFSVDATGHEFYIKTAPGNTSANAYNDGVTNNGAGVGDVVFVVPLAAPDTLYYNCGVHSLMGGTILIVG